MKLKSKDEIILKLIEKLEEYESMEGRESDRRFTVNGQISILKWILTIEEDERF